MNNFYFPQLTDTHSTIDLHGEELRHIVAARRLKVGDKLLLFNGKGLIANVQIAVILKNNLSASVINIEQLAPPMPKITLATAIPKGDRINTLLDMSTQLGMSDFVPIKCERSIAEVNLNKYPRFRRICINACKQSRRYFIPKIHSPVSLSELLEIHKASHSLMIAADPGGQTLGMNDAVNRLFRNTGNLVFVVGPEGGFSEPELRLLADQDILKLKLSDAILRIETACVSLLSKISNRQWS